MASDSDSNDDLRSLLKYKNPDATLYVRTRRNYNGPFERELEFLDHRIPSNQNDEPYSS